MQPTSLKITIIGLNYRPEVTGIAPYTSSMAEGLARRGHQVKVVTGFPHYPAWTVNPSYTGFTVDEQAAHVRIRRVRQYTPSNPSMPRRIVLETTFGIRAVMQHWSHPDVVVCVSPALLSTAFAATRVNLSRTPPTMGGHGCKTSIPEALSKQGRRRHLHWRRSPATLSQRCWDPPMA